MEEASIDKWMEFLGLNQQRMFAGTFLHLVAENFLLQITEETYNYEWLNNYLEDINGVLKQMSTAPGK